MDLAVDDFGHRSIILNGFYELLLSKAITDIAKKGGLLVDVGANYGYFSCLWAGADPSNKVVAFEASPLNVLPLKKNISGNNLDKQVKVEPFALGKEVGRLKFDLGNKSGQTGWGGLVLKDSDRTVDVEVDTLDSYSKKWDIHEIQVLKIDTEGADTWVILGAAQLIKEKKIKNIFFEANKERMKAIGIDPSEALVFLQANGYVVKEFTKGEFYAYPAL